MAPFTVLRPIFFYLLLVLVVRTVGRRPGKQFTPFEVVLVFFMGGLALTAMVGTEASLTNAISQIATVAAVHVCVVILRHKSPAAARITDCTALVLYEAGQWRKETMHHLRMTEADVMSAVRLQQMGDMSLVRTVVLERSGEISVIPEEQMSDGNIGSPEEPQRPAVNESQAHVEDHVAVGEDMRFQRRWWKFETLAWSLFGLIIIADAVGLLGNGPLTTRTTNTPNGELAVRYNAVMRSTTPATLSVEPSPAAIHDGKFRLFISNSVVKDLGAKQIAPQPASSTIGNGGITYEFPATTTPATVTFSLEPATPGSKHFSIGVPGGDTVSLSSFIMP